MKLRFTPPKSVGKYALFVDYGNDSSYFKVYNDLGHAKNAARMRTRHWDSSTKDAAKILEMVDGEWYVLYDIPKGTEDFPWVKEVPVRWTSRTVRRARPMTRDEYADFRVKVFAEKHNLVAA